MIEMSFLDDPERRAVFYDQGDSDNVCFLCGEPKYQLLRQVTHYGLPLRFMRCQCGLIKQTPLPAEPFFSWFFNSELFFSSRQTSSSAIWGYYDYFADEACRLATSELRYRKLRRVFSRTTPLEILEIAAATGTLPYIANRRGHHATGCDVSKRFVEYANERYGVRVDHGRFERLDYARHSVDVLLLFNAIENIPNAVELLTAARQVLKPGGILVLNFVDARINLLEKLQKERYFLYRPPICYIYSLPVMKRVLANFGFTTIACHRDVRYLHIEKIATLLGWKKLLATARRLRIERLGFPIYAYPSRVLVAQRGAEDMEKPEPLR